jgi:hypothetical protein
MFGIPALKTCPLLRKDLFHLFLPASNLFSTSAGSSSYDAFYTCSTAKDEQAPQQQQQGPPMLSASAIRPHALRMAGILSCAQPQALAGSLQQSSFAASQAIRGLGTLSLPKRLSLAGTTARTLAPARARTFYTQGEVFGTVFQFTTNTMFWAGIIGAAAFRRNLIVLMLSSEVVMLACNMNFLFASAYLNDITGVIM